MLNRLEGVLVNPRSVSRLAQIIDDNESSLLDEWINIQLAEKAVVRKRVSDTELREDSGAFLSALREGVASGEQKDISRPSWGRARKLLEDLSSRRAALGFTPAETATFIFSFKQPLFARLREQYGSDGQSLAEALWESTTLLDSLGLFTITVYQQSREQVITRQQQEMLELSTPVVRLWDGILALPLIGTLDSARTQVVMQNLLQAIVESSASIAIIDITGVPTVDTLVAQHLLKTVSAARLMGADCIISGIRPQIAQTIIHLGVELSEVTTKATLADAFKLALRRLGSTLSSVTPA